MADEHRELIAKDIVDQLRLHKPQFTAGVCSRAIQEITRLRAENAELRAKLPVEYPKTPCEPCFQCGTAFRYGPSCGGYGNIRGDAPPYIQTTDMTGPSPDPAAYPRW